MKVVLLGGSGFIGRALARQLCAHGHEVVIPTRVLERARELFPLPTASVTLANIRNEATLRQTLAGCDAVVNLVGILHPERGSGFDAAHVELPRAVAKACADLGIPRLVHMSALNADVNGPSAYLRSRGQSEAAVLDALKGSGVALTLLRPSVVFGREDNFLNMLAGLVRMYPVIPLGSARAQFQPVHVEDVAAAIVASLEQPAKDATHELVGPEVFTLRDLVIFVITTLKKRRVVIELPHALAMLQAMAFEFPPGKWLGAALGIALTRDNVRSMSQPNVSSEQFPFGIRPASLRTIAPTWLLGENSRSHYQSLRSRAAR